MYRMQDEKLVYSTVCTSNNVQLNVHGTTCVHIKYMGSTCFAVPDHLLYSIYGTG